MQLLAAPEGNGIPLDLLQAQGGEQSPGSAPAPLGLGNGPREPQPCWDFSRGWNGLESPCQELDCRPSEPAADCWLLIA